MLERQTTVLVRKKLPWLDGGKIPGQFDSKESLGLDNVGTKEPTRPEKAQDTGRPSLGADPALRAIGSTPSLRQGSTSAQTRTLSVNSQPRRGSKPVASKQDGNKTTATTKQSSGGAADYASSLYSVTPPVDPGEGVQSHAKAESYERLIEKRPSTNGKADRNPFKVANAVLQDELDAPLDSPVSPKQQGPKSSQPEPTRGLRRSKPKPISRPPASESNALDRGGEVPTKLRRVSTVKTLPRQSIVQVPTVVREASPPPPPPPPPTRKPTLFAMPTHLLGSSSSSSQSYSPSGHSQLHPGPVTAFPQRPPQPLPSSPPVVPARNPQHVRRESESLNRAVTGLENLMQEALNVARDAAQTGRNDEVAGILNSATYALRRASTVHGQLNSGRMSQPLVLSPPISEAGSDSHSSDESHSDASSDRSDRHSFDTVPTFVTKSAQSSRPVLVEQKQDGYFARPQKASFESVEHPPAANTRSPDRHSISPTPPRLYQPASADSIVRDFAYARAQTAKSATARKMSRSQGAANDYYGDSGRSVASQPGVRLSVSAPIMTEQPPPPRLASAGPRQTPLGPSNEPEPLKWRKHGKPLQQLEPVATLSIPPRTSSKTWDNEGDGERPEPTGPRRRRERQERPHHVSRVFESSYYRQPPRDRSDGNHDSTEKPRDGGTDAPEQAENRYAPTTSTSGQSSSNRDRRHHHHHRHGAEHSRYSSPSPAVNLDVSLKHPRRKHISLRDGQGFSLGRHHRRQPIAREWNSVRKRITATIACLNTVFVGLITGIYAGEVPRIQYQLADTTHKVILGNVVLFACLGLTTLIFWPLPLLHGRKPYTLVAFALMLPLMFPQAIVVSSHRDPNDPLWRCGLLIPRAFKGLAMGFANINFLPTLFDLFGASLMSAKPHQEIVVYDDVRRQGGGVGIWLGIWSFCFVGSMSIGFSIGAFIIAALDPSWGFYIVVILLAFFLLVNVIAPETRRAPYRRSIAQFLDGEEKVKRRVARGEVLLHISNDGPKWWFQEVWAGLVLTKRMLSQFGFLVMVAYLGWMYAQVTLVILLLGALLTRDYKWQPQYVGAAVLSVAIGALLAVPLSKANIFSRARDTPQRTDSMTMQHHRHQDHVHWSSHMLRRCIFTLLLPCATIAYTLTSPGPSISWAAPTIFCGVIGFLSNLAIAECVGLIMETFDTCDLQPGVNQKHRLQSMAESTRRRRTNYSSFPRICAGFFAAQSTGFFLSAAATGVSGDITRAVGAQKATAIVAGTLLVLTFLFIVVLWRWKAVQVIPDDVFAGKKGGVEWAAGVEDPEWKPVIIGNPSGKMRRENVLEMGSLSRWTEIRRLNKLIGG